MSHQYFWKDGSVFFLFAISLDWVVLWLSLLYFCIFTEPLFTQKISCSSWELSIFFFFALFSILRLWCSVLFLRIPKIPMSFLQKSTDQLEKPTLPARASDNRKKFPGKSFYIIVTFYWIVWESLNVGFYGL